MPDTGVIQNYTAPLGGRVDLQCPIQPGALQQHYSVMWTKDDVEIANSQSTGKPESRYDIDRATYALIIDPVDEGDTSSSYQCQVFVTHPITNTKQQLQHRPQLASGVQLSLRVEPAYELIYRTDATTELIMTGSITMQCRSFTTTENIPISEVQFWLNYTTCNNATSLREREDVNVLEVDSYSIKFNLTRNLEGYYTCGKQVDENCTMSTKRELICKYNTLYVSAQFHIP